MKLLAVVAERAREHRVAQRDGVAHDGVKHRLNVGRRAANDLENLGGRRLPLERLLRLVEQAHVLDRDHRLAGEGLEGSTCLSLNNPVSGRATVMAPTV